MTRIRIFTASLALGAALAGPGLAHGPGGGATSGFSMMGPVGSGMGAMHGMGPGVGPGMMNGGPGQFGSHGGAMGLGRGDASAMMGGPGGMSGMHDMAGMMQMMMRMHGAGGGPGMDLMGPADAWTDRLDVDGDGTVTAEEAHEGMQGASHRT